MELRKHIRVNINLIFVREKRYNTQNSKTRTNYTLMKCHVFILKIVSTLLLFYSYLLQKHKVFVFSFTNFFIQKVNWSYTIRI